jgi:capsid portal protein
LILETAPLDASTRLGPGTPPRIEVKPLTDQQLKDAMFMEYDGSNRRKVRSAFGLAPIFTGETEDYTRATAENSRLVDEEQIFRPLRMKHDYGLNRWLLLDAQYLKFVSLGPNVTLNEDLIAALTAAETAGAMTPNLGRTILSDVLERDVPQIEEEWGNIPFSLTMGQLRAVAAAAFGQTAGGAGADGQQAMVQAMLAGADARGKALAALLAKTLPRGVKEALLKDVREVVRREIARLKVVERE